MYYKFSLVLGFLSLVTASTASPIPANQSLVWQTCPSFVALAGSRMTCANFSVPLDWDNPGEKGQVQLGISRLPARDPNVRTVLMSEAIVAVTDEDLESHWKLVLQSRRPG